MSIVAATLLLAAAAAAPVGGGCLLIGDSNALRMAADLPDCVTVAKNGITSSEVLAYAPPDTGFTRVIVSMGGADWKTKAPLADNLARMRRLYPRSTFTWLAPRAGQNAEIVADFAAGHHDAVVRLGEFTSRDNTHPDRPSDVAARLK